MRFRELADDPHTQTTCPIDRNTFEEDDSILQIRHCGHIFREMNLRQHFRRRPTCPLCRYDIRDYVAPETSTSGASPNSPVTVTRSVAAGSVSVTRAHPSAGLVEQPTSPAAVSPRIARKAGVFRTGSV